MAGGVADGQAVSQAITNPAFLIKNADDFTVNKIGLKDPAGVSGPILYDNAQRALNTLDTTTGATETVAGTNYGTPPAGTILNGDSHQTALNKIAQILIDATISVRGLINTASQSFAGLKTFTNGLIIQNYFGRPKLDFASAATINALTYNPFVKLTGTTASTINGIASGADGKSIIIHNGTTQIQTFTHESGSATAADRLKLPGGNNISLPVDSSIEFVYDSTQSRWIQKSGSGSGGFGTITGTATLPDNTSNTVIASRSTTTFKGMIIRYHVSRSFGQNRTGTIYIATDTVGAAYSDIGAETQVMGVTLLADVSGGNMRFLATTTSTGTAANIRYELTEIPTP